MCIYLTIFIRLSLLSRNKSQLQESKIHTLYADNSRNEIKEI